MFKNTLFISGVFIFALAILLISIFNSSAIKYPVSQAPGQLITGSEIPKIDYMLPYTGNILPDSPFWKLKALRDRVWFEVTASHLRKAELALLFSDKRLAMTQSLVDKGEFEIAMSTFTKGEKYLLIAVKEEKLAREQNINTDNFLIKLATSALKHKEIAEDLMRLVPEDAKPLMVKTDICADEAYEAAKNALILRGNPFPINPFNGE
jgi:hypothetical protein